MRFVLALGCVAVLAAAAYAAEPASSEEVSTAAGSARVITVVPSTGPTGPGILAVVGGAQFRSLAWEEATASGSTIEIAELDGRSIALVTLRLPSGRSGEPAGVRIEDAAGRAVQAQRVPRAASDVARAPVDETSTTTLTWRGDDGSEATIVAFRDTPIELGGVAPTITAPVSPAGDAAGGLPTPLAFALLPVGPNPFGASTQIRFTLPEAGQVTLDVFDLAGRRMARILDERREAGVHAVEFRPAGLARGRYYVQLAFSDATGTVHRTATRSIVQLR
jgi:hypothetical protein